MRARLIAAMAAGLLAFAPTPTVATDCAAEVTQAQESARRQYIQGVSGLAANNFSQRPGSFTRMACLDRFMQGNMDIMFRPPQLNDLLSIALNFACQQASQAMQGLGGTGGGGGQLLGMLGGLAGGLNVPMAGGGFQTVNLNQALGQPRFNGQAAGAGTLTGLFR